MKKSGFKSLLQRIKPYAIPGIITDWLWLQYLYLKVYGHLEAAE